MEMVKKILGIFVCVISVLLLIWIVLSWGEICIKNLDNPPTYSAWNLFNLLVENA